jgi:beta-lactam-binding protein with PASTA domain
MCATPAWVTEIFNRSGQYIPIPVALNKVANATRDSYNPVVSIASGATATATKTALTTAGFTAADGNTYDSPYAAGTALAVTDSGTYNGSNSVVGQRRAIADLTGRNKTTLYVHAATGSNTVPTLAGMTENAARAAVIAAGFTVGTVTQTTVAGTAGVTLQVESGTKTVGTPVSFTVNTPPIIP